MFYQYFRYLFLVLSLFATFTVVAQDSRFVIVIDAGHGGHDPGAIGDISREKDINLSISLELGTIIEQNFKDVKVVFTRKSDEYLTLQERADIVNNNHADLFICIHTNSTKGTAAFGAESFTLGLAKSKANLDVAMRENSVILLEDNYKTKYKGFDPSSVDSYIMFEFMQDKYIDKSVEIASSIQKQFADYCHRSDRGVRQAGFWVLHRSACPSVLVEVGFISNPAEERYLNSAHGKHDMATAIFNAVVLYKRDHDRRSGKKPSAVAPKVAQPTKLKVDTVSQKPQTALPSSPVTPEVVQSEGSKANAGTKIVDTLKHQSSKSGAGEKNVPVAAKSATPQTNKSGTSSLSNVVKEVNESTKVAPTVQVEKASSKSNLAYIPSQKGVANQVNSQVRQPKSSLPVSKSRINVVRPDNEEQAVKVDTLAEKSKAPIATKQNENIAVTNEFEKQLPVFKVQILASSKVLKANSSEFKGLHNVDQFEEGGWYKYTIGAEKEHAKINKIRASLLDKFPKAFIIAFYKGKKISEAEAIKIKK